MARRVAEFDWSATALGPIETWPATLKTAVALVMDSGFAKCLCWGEEHITIYNDAFEPILGNKGDCLGLPFSVIWQEAWPSIGPIAAKALAGKGTFIKDYALTVRRSDEGLEDAFFTFAYSPIKDETGKVCGFVDTVMETTERVRFERRAAVSNRELVHRLKNSYALVSAVVRQTARRATSVQELSDKLVDRLIDMGQAQDILSLRNAGKASIAEIVDRLRTRLVDKSHQFTASGPEVSLSDEQTFALTLSLFELATNAVKYGALSCDEGHITITWELRDANGGAILTLHWSESGGPPVSPPRHRGFGSFLIRQLLAAEFGGQVELEYLPSGVVCELTAPV
ncbi:sensor histidine kinase [Paracoccus laeviglucosivorans]|uniref:histidine kinase n=1 Tax=Paracoccus laeviglucosivorans TaxID=1197861 RepID=A0A521FQT8_9RHOB|nr:sensor histidine kinase [Paracoccus laeviglucosivorans]SMO98558.1 Two-component sensor histidine kinase, contains HisKA and HATPase domains [Paracoccus laeviglucosivorans]